MGLSDIEYGWRQEIFDYVDVKIVRSVRLEEKSDEGEWEERCASWVDAGEFEKARELRYSEIQGSILGKARFSDFMDQMFLGVPENKENGLTAETKRLNSIDINIRVLTDEEFANRTINRRIQFLEASEYQDERVYVTVLITKERFDDVCQIAAEPDVSFQIGLNLKCWYWIGPIGDSKIFFKSDGYDPAELAYITTARTVACDEGNDEIEGQQESSKSFWKR